MIINSESIKYSLRNLRHRKARSFLTVFSILVGITTIFIFLSFGMGLYNYTQSLAQGGSADKVLIMAKGLSGATGNSGVNLTDADLRAVKRAAGVLQVTGTYTKVVQVNYREEQKYAYVASYDPSAPILIESFNAKIDRGRFLHSGETGDVVLGYNYQVPGKIFKNGLDINSVIEINGTRLKVVGFLAPIGNPQDDSNVYMTNDYFKKLFPSVTSYTELVAKVDMNNIDAVVSNIQRSLRNERNEKVGEEDFYVQSFQSLINSYAAVLNIIVGFIILIALISVLVSGINTANTMITSVLERFKEIGVLKSVGAKNSDILGIFLFESSFLGFLAGALGVVFGYIITDIAGKILASIGWSFLTPAYSPWLFIGCILFATATGVISGVFPAMRASKISAVQALRYE